MNAPARQLPKGWKSRRLKYVATYNDDVIPESTDDFEELQYVEISDVSLIGGVEEVSTLYFHEAPSRARRRIKSGDILISTVRTYLKAIAAVPAAAPNLIASTGFCVMRPMSCIDPAYLGWVAKSEPFVGEIVARSTGVSYPAIKPSELATLDVPLPPPDIQRRIARFLDEKTARIDALIEKKRALVDRLAEKHQALIVHAVTKGLKPNAKMRDSGIDWLGEIPTHWERGNIRRFAMMRTGHTPSRKNEEYWENCDIPWFTLADVWQLRDGTRTYLGETKEKISKMGVANSAAELLPEGTVVFSRTASIGYSGIMQVPMATSQDFWNWICGPKLKAKYLLYLFRSMKQEFAKLTSGSTHKTIYQPVAAGLGICVPPLVEQEAIVQILEDKLRAIDSAIECINISMTRLAEYRSAVIAAFVTGKLEI